tara:strand:+ start:60 stop:305 length:246 start_codon:yes stop_codon:yes gene_type:complete
MCVTSSLQSLGEKTGALKKKDPNTPATVTGTQVDYEEPTNTAQDTQSLKIKRRKKVGKNLGTANVLKGPTGMGGGDLNYPT